MVYRLAADWTASVAQIDEALSAARFAECGATQPRAMGWVPPRGEAHGALIEAITGQWLLQLMVETKVVPGAVSTWQSQQAGQAQSPALPIERPACSRI